MIRLVKSFNKNSEILKCDMFIPWHFNSQPPCEKLFWATRSLTFTFSTVVNSKINYCIYEIINCLHRIEILNTVKNDLSEIQTITNPLTKKK